MAVTNLHSESAPATKTFRERMLEHDVNGVRELIDGPDDAAITISRHIHGLAAYISATLPERENTNYAAGERPTDALNQQIVSGAFDAIAYLAALANFFACEGTRREGADK